MERSIFGVGGRWPAKNNFPTGTKKCSRPTQLQLLTAMERNCNKWPKSRSNCWLGRMGEGRGKRWLIGSGIGGCSNGQKKSLLLEKNAWGEVGGHSEEEQYQDDFKKVILFPHLTRNRTLFCCGISSVAFLMSSSTFWSKVIFILIHRGELVPGRGKKRRERIFHLSVFPSQPTNCLIVR